DIEGFCAIARIRDGHQGRMLAELAELPAGPAGPLARVPGTHFGRWVILPTLENRHGYAVEPAYLLFSAECDGAPIEYPKRLRTAIPEEAFRIWRHCVDCPEAVDAEFERYLLARRIFPGHSFAAYPG